MRGVRGPPTTLMTEQQQQQQSQFNQRSDNAALALKQELSNQTGREIKPSQVQVDADGQPARPLPPEGSYARQAIEQQRAMDAQAAQQAAQQMGGQPTPQQQLGDQPPVGTPDQAVDGSVAPPLTQQQPGAASEGQPEVSANANQRIQGLVSEKRDLERKLAEALSKSQEHEQLKQQLAAMQAEHQQFLQAHLDELDPEERMRVMMDARFQELLAQHSQQIMQTIMPHLSSLQENVQHTEMQKLAGKYPAFDLVIHGPLIEQFRAKNQNCTIEMAYKAIAEPSELVTREQATSHPTVPPVVPPGNGAPMPRYVPEPQADPVDELRQDQQRAYQLLTSENAAERRQGMRDVDDVLARRLAGANYKDKPKVFG